MIHLSHIAPYFLVGAGFRYKVSEALAALINVGDMHVTTTQIQFLLLCIAHAHKTCMIGCAPS